MTVFVATSKRFYAEKEVIMPIQEGKTAPAFTLPDAYGKKVALKDFRGKNIVVYFYPKDNTSG
jgi:peroxiredoxin